MKNHSRKTFGLLKLPACLALLALCATANAVDRYVSLQGGHAPPFTDWAAAATNIQDAIDAAAVGDVIWVTNGVYATGGKVMAGDLTNRVALDKAVTVQSVNGPQETVIQGQWDVGSTDGTGPGAVRCVWLTNGAALSGFTLRGGATCSAGDSFTLRSGGGVWCASTNTAVVNCVISGNSAFSDGGGSYGGTLNNCMLTGNSAYAGGGSSGGMLKNCALTGNLATYGGGSSQGTLNNCTLTGNSAFDSGGGSNGGTLSNCIIWSNWASSGWDAVSGTLRYSCASSPPSGSGNMAANPKLLADGVHIASTSPCRTNGNALYASGTDTDGQPWANQPSMGCDQWRPQPAITMPPRWQSAPPAGQALLAAAVAGQGPFDCWWTKDGVAIEDGAHYGGAHTTDLLLRGFGLDDAGAYQVVVSNAFGMATSPVARVVVHCVDAMATAPVVPYTNWATAAATIQDAIDAAADGEVIWVTNGLYATGGKVMAGDLTNRVALNKPVMVGSVNGPQETIIQGQWDAQRTNGPGAVRCAWVANGAVLSEFTLRGGATRRTGSASAPRGGGVWCASTNAVVANCILAGNSAFGSGGGSYYGMLNNCTLTGNSASLGGGSAHGTLNNCTLRGNSAFGSGGGFFGGSPDFGTLNNCTLTGNSAPSGGGSRYGILNNCALTGNSASSAGGGSDFGTLNNCTLTGNSAPSGGGSYSSRLNNCIAWGNLGSSSNYYSGVLYYTCASPLGPWSGSIATDPQLVDGTHIAVTSPCRTKGNAFYASSVDIDGESWANPPSMGCDEVWEAGLTGPLSVAIAAAQTEVVANRALGLTGWITGRASRLEWAFGDGPAVTNVSYLAAHAWTNTGDYTVTFTAFNLDHPAGVSTNLLVHVVPLELPVLAAGGMSSNNYQLTFGSQAGVYYVVEYATNLTPPMVWQTLQSRTSTGGVIAVQDSNATNAARFYRVRMP